MIFLIISVLVSCCLNYWDFIMDLHFLFYNGLWYLKHISSLIILFQKYVIYNYIKSAKRNQNWFVKFKKVTTDPLMGMTYLYSFTKYLPRNQVCPSIHSGLVMGPLVKFRFLSLNPLLFAIPEISVPDKIYIIFNEELDVEWLCQVHTVNWWQDYGRERTAERGRGRKQRYFEQKINNLCKGKKCDKLTK